MISITDKASFSMQAVTQLYVTTLTALNLSTAVSTSTVKVTSL